MFRPRLSLCSAVLAAVLSWGSAQASIGFTTVDVPDPNGPPLAVGIWYPASGPASPHSLALFTQTVAPDASPAGTGHPLVVISHGNGGSLSSHYDTALALAEAGFVVAAVTHTGDNYRDHHLEARLWMRPPQVSAMLDYVLHSWAGHGAIDPERVGMFGFSAGGFTALVSVGGKPDLSTVRRLCKTHAHTFTSLSARAHASDTGSPAAANWAADPRSRAAVVAAPALGFAFTKAGMASVTVPVQLWAAADDHILPVADYAGAVHEAWPRPLDYHLVPGADHFDFLAPCSPGLAQVAPPICQEANGFDRTAFHARFNAAVVAFFQQALR